jgi:hypothetical protein
MFQKNIPKEECPKRIFPKKNVPKEDAEILNETDTSPATNPHDASVFRKLGNGGNKNDR